MSNLLKIARKQINSYKKELLYLLASANTIHDFCLLAENFYKDNKNEIENIKSKKISRKINKISFTL
ncbi:MAG: hypothetical protein LUH05_05585, partial [Candidatus Gastranaerophilales bacterium]|nr:hypothetical protein [Candidatus Gastranaerophilales bacterium]